MNDLLHLLLDGHHGVYIPQLFAQQCTAEQHWKYSDEDRAILLAGPDYDEYWDAWDSVLNEAYWIDPKSGNKYYIDQNDDLWMIRDGYHRDEEGNLVNSETDEIIEP